MHGHERRRQDVRSLRTVRAALQSKISIEGKISQQNRTTGDFPEANSPTTPITFMKKT
jgi:hypothetical protein